MRGVFRQRPPKAHGVLFVERAVTVMGQRDARLRWVIMATVAAAWTAIVIARLAYLQLFRYSDYYSKAQRQQERVFEVSPTRGTIYDRNGRELAVSLPMDSCFADPAEIEDPAMIGGLLAGPLGISAEEIETKIRQARTPVRLARKLAPEVAERVEAMNLRGVFFEKESRRVYPQKDLAAAALGYVDVDEKGIGGIEYSLDAQIRGRPGRMMVSADGRQRWYDRRDWAPKPGDSVTLTLDENIQYIAEKELERGIRDTHAKHGVVVVQKPDTGELLAVANWPPFDANNAGSYPAEAREDRAVSAAYEPGSVFKVITMTAAIESGVVTEDTLVDCQMGSITLARRVIHDHARYGVLTVRQILEHSSDVGAIKVALRVGAPRFYEVIRSFGIGQPTGILLPGENRGLLRPVEDWSGNSIGSLAMGQEVSGTPIQIISAISAIANGGTLYPPRIVKEIRGDTPPPSRERPEPRRATDGRTAATLRDMMEGVVLEGTGKRYAQLDGYTAAGKTGTAQKVDPATGRYSRRDYMSSFAGFAPVNNPAVTILVVFDSARGGHEGNETAGPVFKRVAEETLAYLGVPHDVPPPENLDLAREAAPRGGPKSAGRFSRSAAAEPARAQGRIEPEAASLEAAHGTTVAISNDPGVLLPDFTGESVRAVMQECVRAGLDPQLVGSGLAESQAPAAGSRVLHGSRITVVFGAGGARDSSRGLGARLGQGGGE